MLNGNCIFIIKELHRRCFTSSISEHPLSNVQHTAISRKSVFSLPRTCPAGWRRIPRLRRARQRAVLAIALSMPNTTSFEKTGCASLPNQPAQQTSTPSSVLGINATYTICFCRRDASELQLPGARWAPPLPHRAARPSPSHAVAQPHAAPVPLRHAYSPRRAAPSLSAKVGVIRPRCARTHGRA